MGLRSELDAVKVAFVIVIVVVLLLILLLLILPPKPRLLRLRCLRRALLPPCRLLAQCLGGAGRRG